jgi:hypothetical protein
VLQLLAGPQPCFTSSPFSFLFFFFGSPDLFHLILILFLSLLEKVENAETYEKEKNLKTTQSEIAVNDFGIFLKSFNISLFMQTHLLKTNIGIILFIQFYMQYILIVHFPFSDKINSSARAP